ncbi:MAG TPA: hypothetical protein VM658_13570 [bacterium]|nr:hypothetical protein [bacterium]
MPEEYDSATVIEETDSGENHYVLKGIEEKLAGIMSILQAGHEASESMREQAEEVLEAHRQSAQEYLDHVNNEPDFYPFVTMPAGTTVRDLPDGGRLFTLTDGVFVRTSPDGTIFAVMEDGEAVILEPARAGKVTLPDGRELTLVQEAVMATHEAAGIEGLPLDIEPTQVADGRFSVNLPGNMRLDVCHREHLATVINPLGTVVVLGIARIEGVGEEVITRIVAGGARGFASQESNHQGIIEANGTIHVALSNGLDLVIHFPEAAEDSGSEPQDETKSICEERV